MWKGLDVLITAMRKENPDLVVMYYNLSPLFLDYFDLLSPDDLFENAGEYDVEANRRFFFSSLLGQLGIPTYSSTGYDWAATSNIWFDAAALGTIGSMNDFKADEQGEGCTPELAARYNGITHVLRPTINFEISPLDYVPEAPTLGAHARSWARFEAGQLVLLLLFGRLCPATLGSWHGRRTILALRVLCNPTCLSWLRQRPAIASLPVAISQSSLMGTRKSCFAAKSGAKQRLLPTTSEQCQPEIRRR